MTVWEVPATHKCHLSLCSKRNSFIQNSPHSSVLLRKPTVHHFLLSQFTGFSDLLAAAYEGIDKYGFFYRVSAFAASVIAYYWQRRTRAAAGWLKHGTTTTIERYSGMTFSCLIMPQFLRSVTRKFLFLPSTSSPAFSSYFSSLSPSPPDQNDGNPIEREHKLVSDILAKKCGFARSSLPLGLKKSQSVYFLNTVQFSDRPEQAISFLKGLGIKENALRKMILQHPYILSCRVEKMMSKVNYFETLGMDRVKFIKMLSVKPRVLTAKLNGTMIPKITYFKGVLQTGKDLIQVLTRQPSVLFQDLERRIKPSVEFLRSRGICERELSSLIVHNPRIIMRNVSNSLVNKVNYVEELGFRRGSKMFTRALMAVDCMSEETLEGKVENLKSFGLLDHEISRIVRASPAILTLSTERVQRTMDFVLNTLRLPANTVADCCVLLTCSLETRLKPRLRVLDALRMMCLLSREYRILTVMRMTNKQFLDKFVDCYSQSEQLLQIYKGLDEFGTKEFMGT